jgi:microcystin-dependent protein
MSYQYLGQLLLVSFNYPPKSWALCNGQLLPINQNQALFALIGTTYGGDGTTTFALPNLQGQVAISSSGSSYVLGQSSGSNTVTLTTAQMPAHTHTLTVSSASGGVLTTPQGNTVGTTASPAYASSAGALMDTGAISSVGSSQGHENRSPFLVLNWVIALSGIFPSQN